MCFISGVSCDSCLKSNFRGKRYKCLICYDYDLCATCFEAGATTTRHTTDHPVQCIITRSDFGRFSFCWVSFQIVQEKKKLIAVLLQFLAWLFSEKTCGFAIALLSLSLQKLLNFNIFVITEYIYLQLGVCVHFSKSNPYYQGRQFKMHFFFFFQKYSHASYFRVTLYLRHSEYQL